MIEFLEDNLMTISYVLFENHLTSDPDDYMARVQPSAISEQKQVVERMIQAGSTVTRADIYSVLEDYYSTVENMVLEGHNVNTPLANFRTTIKGVFQGAGDGFDASRHRIVATIAPGKRLRNVIAIRAQALKGEMTKPKPNPVEYYDVASGNQRNTSLSPNGFGRLLGHRLKFNTSDENQGIFFLAEDGTATRVTVIGQNKPAELMFSVPALPAGEYTLEVRAVFGDDDLRTGSLDAVLMVA